MTHLIKTGTILQSKMVIFQDVGNSPSMEPTMTFTGSSGGLGGAKKDRRASLGRRVSFSAATKVKEFRADERDFTLWNSTYEEERSNIISSDSSSSHKSDDDVFVDNDKTFVANDDMDVTEVQAANVQLSLMEKFGTKKNVVKIQSSLKEKPDANKTVVNNENMEVTMAVKADTDDMEMTEAVPKVQESRGEKKTVNIANESCMDITEAVPKMAARNEKHEVSMEMTGAVPCLQNNAGVKPQELSMEMTEAVNPATCAQVNNQAKDSQARNLDVSMEMTEAVPSLTKCARSSKEKTNNDVSMEMTKAVPSIISKVSADSNGANASMEMTEAVPAIAKRCDVSMEMTKALPSLISKVPAKSENANTSMEMTKAVPAAIAGVSASSNEKTSEVSMEMTQALPSLSSKVPAKAESVNTSMEMTEAVPAAIDKVSANSNEKTSEVSMEMTKALPSLTSEVPAIAESANTSMEMTEAVNPATCAQVNNQAKDSQARNLDVSMEMTEAVPSLTKCARSSKEKTNNDVSMEMTKAVPSIISKVSADSNGANASMEMTEAVPAIAKRCDVSMEMTKALPSLISKVPAKSENANTSMEMTKAVPAAIAGVSASSNEKTSEVSMEMTQALPSLSSKVPAKAESVNTSMKMTEVVPAAIDQVSANSNEKTSEVSMEMTKALPSSSSKVKAESVNTSMKMTEVVQNEVDPSCEKGQEVQTPEGSDVENLDSTNAYLAECEKKSEERRDYINGLKRFLDNLDKTAVEEDEPPMKKAKKASPESVFQQIAQARVDRCDLGNWSLVEETSTTAVFGFFLKSWQLHIVLGHAMPTGSKQRKNYAIRKVSLVIKRHQEAESSIKLADYLFARQWSPERLASLFKTTDDLAKSLKTFGDSVNEAAEFVFDMDDIQGIHCGFAIDLADSKVSIEFISRVKVYSFEISVCFGLGFKNAKYENTILVPGIDSGHYLTRDKFKTIVSAVPSGWQFLKNLTHLLDEFVSKSEMN